jgi:hypothetical protein
MRLEEVEHGFIVHLARVFFPLTLFGTFEYYQRWECFYLVLLLGPRGADPEVLIIKMKDPL